MKLTTTITTTTATTILLALSATLPTTSADGSGLGNNIVSCKNKNFKGDCKTISLAGKLDTCIATPDDPVKNKYDNTHQDKYSDKGSSFQVNGHVACRLFRKKASYNCKEPSVEPIVGITGKDNQRATNWIAYPGIDNWQGMFKFKSFMCTSLEGKTVAQLPKVVVAECAADDDVGYGCRGMDTVA